MKTILNGIFKENSIFVLLLGLCSSLAITNTLENAYLMGICVTVVLVFSNLVVSIIRKLVPDDVRIPTYIIIVGTFVTILEIVLKEYVFGLYKALGIYLPLIVVNCIVLGRALSVASKVKPGKAVLDGIGVGIGYMLAISLIAIIREILGSNTITLMDSISSLTGYRMVYKDIFPVGDVFPMSIFTTSTGAFLTLAFLMALFNKLRKRGRKNESN